VQRPWGAFTSRSSLYVTGINVDHWSGGRGGMHQHEATRGFSVQRVGEMGGVIQFTQVESEKHFIGEQN